MNEFSFPDQVGQSSELFTLKADLACMKPEKINPNIETNCIYSPSSQSNTKRVALLVKMSVNNVPPEGLLYNMQKSKMRSRHSKLKAAIMFYKEAWLQVAYYNFTKYVDT